MKLKKIKPEKSSLYFRKWLTSLTLRLKNFLYFLRRNLFLYFWKWNPALFSPSSKNKKIHPEKIYYTLLLKNVLYFFKRKLFVYFRNRKPQKESFSYISGNGNAEKILYISGGTSKAPKTKISYISPKKAMNKFF